MDGRSEISDASRMRRTISFARLSSGQGVLLGLSAGTAVTAA
jgi:hypothetical protein